MKCLLHLGVNCITQAEIDQHLEMGKKLFAAGQLADALTHYHAAVGEWEFEVNNYYLGTHFLFTSQDNQVVECSFFSQEIRDRCPIASYQKHEKFYFFLKFFFI